MTSLFKPAAAFAFFGACLAWQAMAQTSANTSAHSHHGAQHKASATARSVLPFDEKTWAQLLTQGPRPSAYLFTTSYCSTCPAAFAVLHDARQAHTRITMCPELRVQSSRRYKTRFAAGQTRVYVRVYYFSGTP